jgi:glycosyltransferase involved in cell wall biosynthesis
VTVPVDARKRVEWVRGEQVLLPRFARRAGVELLHSLGGTGPAWGRFRRVITIHDLIYKRYPEAHGGLRARGMAVLVPLAARRSARIITVSHSSRHDLVELLGIDPERIDVVPNGLGARRQPSASGATIRKRLAIGGRRVLLTLSAKRRHKNLLTLLDALALIPVASRPLLVIPGYRTDHEAELVAHGHALGVDDDVRIVGWLDPGELEALWTVADAFVFPSLYEGFGLPVVEAMARGIPVACANTSSLPEVAGGAALLFDPRNPTAIARAVEALLDNPAEAERLRRHGRERAATFTWERAARGVLDSYTRT